MSFGAVMMIFVKKFWTTDNEIQRYQYAREKYEKENPGKKWSNFNMQVEIFMQAVANCAVLIIPGMLICNDKNKLTWIEITGFVLWLFSYYIEASSDSQKRNFIIAKKKAKDNTAVCNIGWWKYSRHPNYFGEWMVWNSQCIMAIQSVLNLDLLMWQKAAIFYTFVMLSVLMFYCLVLWTGTKPAEAGSVVKRPGYKAYQESTSMLFPWFPNQKPTNCIMRFQDWLLTLG